MKDEWTYTDPEEPGRYLVAVISVGEMFTANWDGYGWLEDDASEFDFPKKYIPQIDAWMPLPEVPS